MKQSIYWHLDSITIVQKFLTYEQPLNERMRTFLRLEFLFTQARHSLHRKVLWDSRVTIERVLDILSICSRTDLKTEVLKELERQTANLGRLENNPDVDKDALNRVLDQLDVLSDRLHAINGQIGQVLKESELLKSIRQRNSIPGGTCHFDIPGYYFWLSQPAEQRIQDLDDWLSIFEPIKLSIELLLRLLRESAQGQPKVAAGGFYQQALEANIPYQMIRVTVPDTLPYFAEISGGKHRFTVRFMQQRINERPTQSSEDVQFELACCVI